MVAFIGIGICMIAILLSSICEITIFAFGMMLFIGVGLILIPFLFKPQFEERKLVRTYDILSIVPGVYAIKTCQGKIIFKYVDFEEDDKVIIDSLNTWNEVVELQGKEQPVLSIYEQKAKRTWLTLPAIETRYIEVLKIPKDSIITK